MTGNVSQNVYKLSLVKLLPGTFFGDILESYLHSLNILLKYIWVRVFKIF
jgi:hypothetical protein